MTDTVFAPLVPIVEQVKPHALKLGLDLDKLKDDLDNTAQLYAGAKY